MKKYCTRCKHAKVYMPRQPLQYAYITCPYRKGYQTDHAIAPTTDSFVENSPACEKFIDIDNKGNL
jgi:hypothetical protein